MNALQLKIISLLFIFMLSTNFVQTQSHMSMSKAPKSAKRTVDYKKQLPSSIRSVLDKMFQHWNFQAYQSDCDAEPPFSKCNLNGDGIPDFAMDLVIKSDSDSRESFVAMVSNDTSYTCFVLDTLSKIWTGHYYLEIFPAGTDFDYPPFESEGDNRTSFKTDCIEESMCNNNSFNAFYYEKGRFRHFSDGD